MRGWKMFLIVLGSLLWLTSSNPTVQGCGYFSVYLEEYSSFFLSNLAHDQLFQPYYYDPVNRRGSFEIDYGITESQHELNLREWQAFWGGAIPLTELDELVYKMSVSDLKNLYSHPPSVTPQVWMMFYKPENQPALEYLIYAKQCEYHAVIDSPWDYEAEIQKRRQPQEMQEMIKIGLSKYRQTNSSFLKLRYGYQIVRLAHYAGKPKDCIKYYDQLIAKQSSNSIIAAWAYRHKIGALHQLGRKAEALVLSSLLFDQNPKMRDEAYLDFSIPPDPVWQECLRIAGQPHRQATLWMLRGLKDQRITLEPLQKMYQLEPSSSRLEVMLVRQINRIEREYPITAVLFDSNVREELEKRAIALKYIRELHQFIATVDKQTVRQPALWYAAAAYLSILEHNPTAAQDYLVRAQNQNNSSTDLSKQIILLQNLNAILARPNITPALEVSCYESLKWLDPITEAPCNLVEIRESFYAVLAHKYLAAGEIPKGLLCLTKADLRADFLLDSQLAPAEFDKIIALLAKKNQSPFEMVLTTNSPYSIDDLYSIKGTALLRRQRFQEALASLAKVTPAYWKQVRKEWSNESWGQIRTDFAQCHYNPHTGLYKYPPQGFPHYTKLEFVRKVVELNDLARRQPQQADRYYFQLGNGFFHTPFWAYNENLKGSKYDGYFYQPRDLEFWARRGMLNRPINYRKIAQGYYLKAMQLTKDRELAAQCCFMAQACQTEFSWFSKFEEPGRDQDYYFKTLKQRYSQTKFYRNVVRECATLKDFLGGVK